MSHLPPPINFHNGWPEYPLFIDNQILTTNMKAVFYFPQPLTFMMAQIAAVRMIEASLLDSISDTGRYVVRIDKADTAQTFDVFRSGNKNYVNNIVNLVKTARFGDDPSAYYLRKQFLNLNKLNYYEAQCALINQFFHMHSSGNSIEFFYFHPLYACPLFSVRQWKIIDAINCTEQGATFAVRVDSYNRSGRPITLVWKVVVRLSAFGDYCIAKLIDESNIASS